MARLLALAGLVLLLSPTILAQSFDDAFGTTVATHERSVPSGPYSTYASTLRANSIVSTTTASAPASTNTTSGEDDSTTPPSTTITDLVGTRTVDSTSFVSFLANETVSGPTPPEATNSQPCNNHVELCQRRYSNITFVGAHNSPFVREGSAAANQRYGLTEQLNDGVRLLQGQMHIKDGVPHMCHSSCDMLDAGPLSDWLAAIKAWLDDHRFDVVTILIGNAAPYPDPSTWVAHVERTGILDYAYTAPRMPMALDDWPTLAEMILLNRRAVLLLDYKADYSRWPWLLDEFGVMWETPFDPVDRSFPCTVERPPGLADVDARAGRMFLMNHNLNVEFDILGTSILVPARPLLNETNAVSGPGSLGLAAENCRVAWGRPPNFLNVDYYDEGSSPGSVFQVAAAMNRVEYTGTCCGTAVGGASAVVGLPGGWMLLVSVSSVVFMVFMV